MRIRSDGGSADELPIGEEVTGGVGDGDPGGVEVGDGDPGGEFVGDGVPGGLTVGLCGGLGSGDPVVGPGVCCCGSGSIMHSLIPSYSDRSLFLFSLHRAGLRAGHHLADCHVVCMYFEAVGKNCAWHWRNC